MGDAATPAAPAEALVRRLARRVREVVVRRILDVDDTPHRIALGVFLGTLVAWTPTLGLQLVLYVALATVLRANKVSGLPLVFVTNPVTAAPCYWLCWRLGALLTGGAVVAEASPAAAIETTPPLPPPPEAAGPWWHELWQSLALVGADLWVGSLVIGVLTGAVAYLLTHRGVTAWRRRKVA